MLISVINDRGSRNLCMFDMVQSDLIRDVLSDNLNGGNPSRMFARILESEYGEKI